MKILLSGLGCSRCLAVFALVVACNNGGATPAVTNQPELSTQTGGSTAAASGGSSTSTAINTTSVSGDVGAGGAASGKTDSSSLIVTGGATSVNQPSNSGGTVTANPAGGTPSASASTNGGGPNASSAATATGGSTVVSNATGGTNSGKGLTIYYVRHAEVVANVVEPDQMTLENSETFTDLGLSQIDALTNYLAGMGLTPDAVIVSPTKRTQKTIEPYLVAKNIQGEIWMELTECCTQTPTGSELPTQPEYISYYKATIETPQLNFRDPDATKYWQTDTYEEGLFMVLTAKEEILSRFGQSGKTVFVVGHASAGAVLIGLLRGNDMRQGSSTSGSGAVYLLNTGIMHLTQDPTTGDFTLEGRNINNP